MQHNGIHHVTAIAGPAQRNHDFYTGTLGLRLVKKTVNFDDPKTYHFYYGDETGLPGSIVTHFPWEHAAQGRVGPGETHEVLLRVPETSLGYWTHRLLEKGVRHETIEKRFGESFLPFYDPDGMRLALVGVPGLEGEGAWINGVANEHAIRGMHGVTLLLEDSGPTAAILTDVFGFTGSGREGTIERYRTDAVMGGVVDIRVAPGFPRGRQGRGSIHHVAFRATDDAAQAEMVRRLAENHRIQTTEQKDRNYFRSVYFREPGHVLFEIATDAPGFAVDEPVESLGQALKLPRGLEPRRAELEAVLPEVA